MQLKNQQVKLLEVIIKAHKNHFRKYTDDPYVIHLINVARLASEYGEILNYPYVEIALCHDTVEDKKMTYQELASLLEYDLDYSFMETRNIMKGVKELTDVYTPENYPHLNRAERKRLEAERLATIRKPYKEIKCSDLIDNTVTIVTHDPDFARVYLKEKESILLGMRAANENFRLLNMAWEQLQAQQQKLWKHTED